MSQPSWLETWKLQSAVCSLCHLETWGVNNYYCFNDQGRYHLQQLFEGDVMWSSKSPTIGTFTIPSPDEYSIIPTYARRICDLCMTYRPAASSAVAATDSKVLRRRWLFIHLKSRVGSRGGQRPQKPAWNWYLCGVKLEESIWNMSCSPKM